MSADYLNGITWKNIKWEQSSDGSFFVKWTNNIEEYKQHIIL